MSDQENMSGIDFESQRSMTLVDYINIFFKHKKIIIINCLVVAAITFVVFFFVLDPIFFSSGTIKTLDKQSGLSGLISSSGIGELGDLGDIAGGTSASKELALFENILLSRRCVEETINKFNLVEEYKFKTMFDGVKLFRENIMEIKKDKLAGTMEVGVFDKDPQKAKEITDFLIEQLNKINMEVNVQNAKNNREFIQSRLDIVYGDLRASEDTLLQYQDMHGIAPDVKVQLASKIGIELEAEIKAEEVKLELLRKILTPDQSEVRAQEEKISILKSQLSEILNDPNQSDNLSLKGSPKIVMDFYRIRRNVEIQNKILTTLIPLLEQAKIEENRNTPSVAVVDPPNVPDRKVKPKRLTMVAIYTMLTFFVTYILFLLKIKWDFYKRKISFS